MKALIIGGSGLISTGIIKHLLARGAEITVFNRGNKSLAPSMNIHQIIGDRNEELAMAAAFRDEHFDVIYDMVCFRKEQAQSAVKAFAGKCGQYVFCSTVCVYGAKTPPGVIIDETWKAEPVTGYGQGKLDCENVFLAAQESGSFSTTVIRPSHTYGPGRLMIDNIETNPVAWDRIVKDKPVLCASDGQVLANFTHRDDVGKMFAFAAGNEKTFGQCYNATRETVLTWREAYATIGRALGKPVKLLFMPAGWIVAQDPKRFLLLNEISQYHGAYTSAKARRDVPEFVCEIEFEQGMKEALADLRLRGAWRDCEGDALYEGMVERAMGLGVEAVTA